MVHRILLSVHSGLRWVALAMLVGLLVQAVRGWRGAELGGRARALKGATIGLVDLQVLLGAALYFTGPWLRLVQDDVGRVMRTSALRFFVIEHVTGVLAAVAVLHVGSVLHKRADSSAKGYKRLAIAVGVALVILVISVPWPFMPYGRPLFRFG